MTAIDHMGVVRDAVAELERAWNAADGAGFGAAFTTDADFVDIRGSHHQGADAIGHGHQAIFDTIYAGSTTRYSAATAAAVTDTSVLGIVESTLDAPAGPLKGVHRATATVLLVQDDDAWKIRAFHNTLVVG